MLQLFEAYQAAINEAAIVSITDLEGKILFINQKFIEISKYGADELIGKSHSVINSGYHPNSFFSKMWQTISKGKHWRGEIKNKTKDGKFYWVDTVITPVMDEKGMIFQYLSIRNLITRQKENEQQLINYQSELIKRAQQLKDAQHVAKTGSWYLDISRNQLDWSEESYHIFEIPEGRPMTYEHFLENVHPVDRDRVDKTWKTGLLKGNYEIEHRIITKSGEKWVRERARITFNNLNKPQTATGTVQDITEKKQAQENLRESEDLYRTLFNCSPFAVAIVEKESLKILEVNETAIKLYGYSKTEFLRLTTHDICMAKDHEILKKFMADGSHPEDRTHYLHQKKNGENMLIEPSMVEIKYKGNPAYLITLTDLTEKIRIQAELNQSKINRQNEILDARRKADLR